MHLAGQSKKKRKNKTRKTLTGWKIYSEELMEKKTISGWCTVQISKFLLFKNE